MNVIVTTAHKVNSIRMYWSGSEHYSFTRRIYNKPMIMVLESSGIAITSDAIKTKFLQKIKTKGTTGHKQESAFYSKNTKKEKRKQLKCFVCDRVWHFASQCSEKPLKRNDQRKHWMISKRNQRNKLLRHSKPLLRK